MGKTDPVGRAEALIYLDRAMHCISAMQLQSLLGDGAREVAGKPISMILHPDQADAVVETLARVFEERAGASIVTQLRTEADDLSVRMQVRHVESAAGDGRRVFTDVLEVRLERLEVALAGGALPATGESAMLGAIPDWSALAFRFAGCSDADLEDAIREAIGAVGEALGARSGRILSVERAPEIQGAWSAEGAHRLVEAMPLLPDFDPADADSGDVCSVGLDICSAAREAEPDGPRAPAVLAALQVDGLSAAAIVPCCVASEAPRWMLEFHWAAGVRLPSLGDHERSVLLSGAQLLAVLCQRRVEADALEGQSASSWLASGDLPGSASVESLAPDESRQLQAFRERAEQMRDGLFEVGGDGLIRYASASFAALVETRPEAIVGCHPLDFVDLDEHRRVGAIFGPELRTRRRQPVVYRARSAGRADGAGGEGGVGDGAPMLEATARAYRSKTGETRVVVSVRDVTEREYTRRALERQVELETRVAELSRFFMNIEVDEMEEAIESRLGFVAALADAQHSWVYSFSNGNEGMELFDWWAEFEPKELPLPAEESVAAYPYSSGLILSGQVYHVASPDDLPAAGAPERAEMIRRGVRSILAIPIMSGGEFRGCLGFEAIDREMRWSEETIMLLRMAGEIFYSALRRRRSEIDLRDSQAKLLQAQKMEAVGTLAGGIAHDFNNHLAVMLGNARFVRQEVEGPTDVLDAIDDFERAADHCAQLTRSLLAFSRRSPVAVMAVDVAELLAGVDGLIRPLLPPSIDLVIDLGPALGSFTVDRVQIQQVLVNLIVNARDAMPQGGVVRLGAARRKLHPEERSIEGVTAAENYLVLTVEDQGIGMDDETIARVFEPFFTTKAPGEGTGLGLAMAYGIVQQSGGAIGVKSEVSRGTRFSVYLPVQDHKETAEQGRPDPFSARAAESSAHRLLLFDPEERRVAAMQSRLLEAGFQVEQVEAPEFVAERVRRGASSIDLVIASLPSPSPPVERFAELLRGGDEGPPMLILSADLPAPASDRSDVVVLEQGADAPELIAAVHALLEGRRVGG